MGLRLCSAEAGEKAPYMTVFAVAYDNHCFRVYKKDFTFTVATRYICFHVYG